MKDLKLRKEEQKLIQTAEAVLELCPTTQSNLLIVPVFAETIDLLRDRLNHTDAQSVKRHEAKSNKEAVVTDVSAEKTALIQYVTEKLGAFAEYARKEKDTQLTNLLPSVRLAQLSKQKTVNLILAINTFVSAAEKLDATKLAKYGVSNTWLETVKDKTLAYKANNTTKESLKANQPKETVEFKTVIADIKDYLLTLTNLVSGYKADAPKLYEDCNALLAPKKKGARTGSKRSTSKSSMRTKAAKKLQKDIDNNTSIVKDI